jgi:hypothetical protein
LQRNEGLFIRALVKFEQFEPDKILKICEEMSWRAKIEPEKNEILIQNFVNVVIGVTLLNKDNYNISNIESE